MQRLLLLLCACGLLSCPSLATDVVGKTGSSIVPGQNARVDYRVAAVKTGPQTSSYYLRIDNDMTPSSMVVCFMQGLKNHAAVDHNVFEIEKLDPNSNPRWKIQDVNDAFYADNMQPSEHFGCFRLSFTPESSFTFVRKTIDWGVPIDDEDLGVTYVDFLRDCEIVECDPVEGRNNYLTPSSPDPDSLEWTNIWGSSTKIEELEPTEQSWPMGNWVTMGETQGRTYPARMVGCLEGAPAGAVLSFAFDGTSGGSYVVPGDPNAPPCGGLSVTVDEPFVIPFDSSAAATLTLDLAGPGCSSVPEEAVIRFSADVLARAGAPVYDPNEFMYQVDVVMVKDTVAPIIDSGPTAARVGASVVEVTVTATDETTLAIGAQVVYSINGGPQTEQPMDLQTPNNPSGVGFEFRRTISGLQAGDRLDYHVVVLDEMANGRTSSPQSFVFPAGPGVPLSRPSALLALLLGFILLAVFRLRSR